MLRVGLPGVRQDGLCAVLRTVGALAHQAAAQNRAVASARRSAELATDRSRAGIVSYLEVVDSNRATLLLERANALITGQRLIAAVQLIKALGGGWTDRELLAPQAAK